MTQDDKAMRAAVLTMPIFGMVRTAVVLGGLSWQYGGRFLGTAGVALGALLGLLAAWNSRRLLEP